LTIHVADIDERAMGPLGMRWFLVFLPLVEGDEGVDGEPRLLESLEHNDDFTDWTLRVRPGLLWDDGEPVTADDIRFSLELWTNPNIGYEYAFYDSLEVIDSHTLRMTFPSPPPSSPFVYNWLAMVPEHRLADNAIDSLFSWPFWIEPVGNGPFRYVRHIPDVMTELEPNPRYYGEAPSIERVILRYGGNAITELLSGNADLADGLDPMQIGRLREDPRFRVYHRRDRAAKAIAWNHRMELFQDTRVRRALTLAIDRAGLHRAINYPADLAIFDVPILPRHEEAGVVPPPLPYDPVEADRLLTEAGWIDTDNDGVRERDGREFRFSLLLDENDSAQAVYLEAAFRNLGVAMEIRALDRSMFRASLRSGDFEAGLWDYNYVESFDEFRLEGYRNEEIQALRDLAWFTIDRERADAALAEMWEIFGEEVPITYLHPKVSFFAAHRRVLGIENDMDVLAQVEHFRLAEPQ
jgi:peptide/nickel transport system substrate-binding protein